MKQDYLTLKSFLALRDALNSCKHNLTSGLTFNVKRVEEAKAILQKIEDTMDTDYATECKEMTRK